MFVRYVHYCNTHKHTHHILSVDIKLCHNFASVKQCPTVATNVKIRIANFKCCCNIATQPHNNAEEQ